MPPQVQDALNSFLNLLTVGNSSDLYIGGNPAHAETFIANAVDLLSQVTNLSDLMVVLQRLHGDETIRGLDKLENIVITANSAYGPIEMTIDPRTGQSKNSQQSMQQIQQAMSSLMSLFSSSFGADLKPFFGEADKLIAEGMNRIPNGAFAKAALERVMSITRETATKRTPPLCDGSIPEFCLRP